MELSLNEKTGHTVIKVSVKKLPLFHKTISGYIEKHGGGESNRNSRFVYFEIYADLLNR